jgi:hypothetical protein
MKNLILFSFLSALLIIGTASAQIPDKMSYQGVLKDNLGNPANGNNTLAFSFYDAETGGTALWSETQNVNVIQGVFSTILGSLIPINLDFDKPYWLGISVNGSAELEPRILLTASAYSYFANTVSDSSITEEKLAPGLSVPPGGSAGGDLSGTYPEPIVSGIRGNAVLDTPPAAGEVLQWNGSAWGPGSPSAGPWQTNGNVIFYDSGKAFINRSSSINSFEYFGFSTPAVNNDWGGMYINTESVTGRPFYGFATNGVARAYVEWDGIDNTYKIWNGGYRLSINNSGNVGIGTMTPTERLDVNGTLKVNSNSGSIRFSNLSTNNGWRFLSPATGVNLQLFEELSSGTERQRLLIEQGGFFQVGHGINGYLAEGFRIRNHGSNNNEWTFYVSNGLNDLFLVFNGAEKGRFDDGTGNYVVSSDRRMKRNIQLYGEQVLGKVMQLQTSKYRYADNRPDAPLTIGFIAQDVQPLFPELVFESNADMGENSLALNYSGFGVIAIKAIQEQQKEIESLKERIEKLEQLIQGR